MRTCAFQIVEAFFSEPCQQTVDTRYIYLSGKLPCILMIPFFRKVLNETKWKSQSPQLSKYEKKTVK
jgi:hypothetical protein